MVRVGIVIFLLWLAACTSKQFYVVTHKAQKKLHKRVVDVAKTDSLYEVYKLTLDRDKKKPSVVYQLNDSVVTKINYPQVFGLTNQIKEDSINQQLKRMFFKNLDNTAKKRMTVIDYRVVQQTMKQLTFTKVVLDGQRSLRNFRAKNYQVNFRSGSITEIPYFSIYQVFDAKSEDDLLALITKKFGFQPYIKAYQEKQQILIHRQNLHAVFGQQDCDFYFTGTGLIGFQKVKIPKIKLQKFMKTKY